MSEASSDGRPPRVLMVCLGNICRSPTAEAALREAADEAGLDVEVDSAGTADYHVGDPPDGRSVDAARRAGLFVEGTGRQVSARDFEDFDLLVAMDSANERALRRLAPSHEAEAKVRRFRDYEGGEIGLDVPDPYYGGEQGFAEVVRICRRAAAGLVLALRDGSA